MIPEIKAVAQTDMMLPQEPQVPSQPDQVLSNKEEHPAEKPQILAELVIEEISIDGMCGVY